MPDDPQHEVLRAVLAIAAADGKFTRSEKGVFENLAKRMGISAMGIWRMKTELRADPKVRENLLKTQLPDPAAALKLLVATARIDGEISTEERELLVSMAGNLGVTGDDFSRVYAEGILAADEIRNSSVDRRWQQDSARPDWRT